MTEERRPWQDDPKWNFVELAKLPLHERRDTIYGARIKELEAALETAKEVSQLAQYRWLEEEKLRFKAEDALEESDKLREKLRAALEGFLAVLEIDDDAGYAYGEAGLVYVKALVARAALAEGEPS